MFGIFDAARCSAVAEFAIQDPENSVCLYNGDSAVEMRFEAPYIFDFTNAKTDVQSFFESGRNDCWGIWFDTGSSLGQIKSHFRKFYYVTFESGKQAYFRFFDPRVFPVFFRTAEDVQLMQFFEPLNKVWAEKPGSDNFYCFSASVTANRLSRNQVNVDRIPFVAERG